MSPWSAATDILCNTAEKEFKTGGWRGGCFGTAGAVILFIGCGAVLAALQGEFEAVKGVVDGTAGLLFHISNELLKK